MEIYKYKMHGEGALPTSTTYGVDARVVRDSMIHRFQSLDTQYGDPKKHTPRPLGSDIRSIGETSVTCQFRLYIPTISVHKVTN